MNNPTGNGAVVERTTGVVVGQAGPPAKNGAGGANRISRGDNIVHEVQGQRGQRAGGAGKIVLIGEQTGKALAAAGGGRLNRVGTGDGNPDAGTGNKGGNCAGKGKVCVQAAITGGDGNKPAWAGNKPGHCRGGDGGGLGISLLQGISGEADLSFVGRNRACAWADVFFGAKGVIGRIENGGRVIGMKPKRWTIMAGKFPGQTGDGRFRTAKPPGSVSKECQGWAGAEVKGDKWVLIAVEVFEGIEAGEVEFGQLVARTVEGFQGCKATNIQESQGEVVAVERRDIAGWGRVGRSGAGPKSYRLRWRNDLGNAGTANVKSTVGILKGKIPGRGGDKTPIVLGGTIDQLGARNGRGLWHGIGGVTTSVRMPVLLSTWSSEVLRPRYLSRSKGKYIDRESFKGRGWVSLRNRLMFNTLQSLSAGSNASVVHRKEWKCIHCPHNRP